MRDHLGHQPPQPSPQDLPHSDLARRLAQGASVRDMMRRGEIGGQALGLIQMMAAREAQQHHQAQPGGGAMHPRATGRAMELN